jgi:hypothetical protein
VFCGNSVVIIFQKFYEPIGEVDVGCFFFWGGVVFEEAGDARSGRA